MTDSNIEALIDDLSSELKPVRRMIHPAARAALLFMFVLGYIGFILFSEGVRYDWADKLSDQTFMFEIIIASALAISALITSAWLCVPDMRGQNWMKSVPVVLAGVIVLWVSLRMGIEGMPEIPMGISHCSEMGFMMAVVSMGAMVLMARCGTTTHPYWMALMNALAIGGACWVGLRFSCPMDDIGHGVVHHFLPFIILGAIIGIAAKKLFKW